MNFLKKAIYWVVGISLGFFLMFALGLFDPITSVLVGSFLGIPLGLGYIWLFAKGEKCIK
ncbi:MAG TPA: hypothetical protein EYG94_02515 [Campylobacterales bacterium]|nr:hypothetical protein [Campylobacterales bacterium]